MFHILTCSVLYLPFCLQELQTVNNSPVFLAQPVQILMLRCAWFADALNLLEVQMAGAEAISNVEILDCDGHISLVSPVVEVPLGLLEHW